MGALSYVKSIRFLVQYYLGIGITSRFEQERRLYICERCPYRFFTFGWGRCGVCGCFLRPKTALRSQVCPEDRWNLSE